MDLGITMKRENTIIEKWPFRLKLTSRQPGGKEEFRQLIGSRVSGKERYVEWKKIPKDDDQ